MTPPQVGGDGHAAIAGTPDFPFNPLTLLSPFAPSPDFGSGLVYPIPPFADSQTTVWSVANTANYLRCRSGGIISKIAIHVVVQNGNICLAVFSNTGAGQAAAPGSRQITTGSIACPAPGYNEISLGGNVTVMPGDWFYMNADNATASFRSTPTGSGPLGSNLGKGAFMQEAVGAVAAPASATPSGVASWVPIMVGLP